MTLADQNNTVDVTKLTDEELDKAIDRGDAGAGDEVVEPVKEDKKVETEPTKEDATISDLEKYKKMVEDSQAMIRKQAEEIGNLRKLATEPEKKEPEKGIDPAEYESKVFDPAYMQSTISDLARKEALKIIAEREKRERDIKQKRAWVEEKVGKLDELDTDIREVLKTDGCHDEAIEEFLKHRDEQDPIFLVNLADRAKKNRELKALKEEVTKLKTATSSEKKDLLKKLDQLGKQEPSAATKGTTSSDRSMDPSSVDLSKLSDAELEALINGTN